MYLVANFGDEFGDSLNLVITLATNLAMNLVNHPLWWQIDGMISWRIWWITNFGANFSDEIGAN